MLTRTPQGCSLVQPSNWPYVCGALMFTWTDEPYRALWDHLLFLSHEANVQNLISGRMNSGRDFAYREADVITKKSRQIASSIAQAHEYYNAADAVTLSTSPLLYFYGMLSLAKALVVSNEINTYLEDVNYHGLHTRPRNKKLETYAKDPSCWELEREFAISDGGVFPRLMNAAIGFSLPDKSEILLGDVIRTDPELEGLYSKLYGKRGASAATGGISLTSDGRKGLVARRRTEEELRSGFGNIDTFFEMSPDKKNGVHLVARPGLDPFDRHFGCYWVKSGGRFFVGGVNVNTPQGKDNWYLSPEVSDYAVMFILSTCVRYKQEFWGDILEGRKSGTVALLQRFVSVSRRRFPNFILDKIFGEEFDYGVAGRMV